MNIAQKKLEITSYVLKKNVHEPNLDAPKNKPPRTNILIPPPSMYQTTTKTHPPSTSK